MNERRARRGGGGVVRRGLGRLRQALDESGVAFVQGTGEGVAMSSGKVGRASTKLQEPTEFTASVCPG